MRILEVFPNAEEAVAAFQAIPPTGVTKFYHRREWHWAGDTRQKFVYVSVLNDLHELMGQRFDKVIIHERVADCFTNFLKKLERSR